MNILLILYVISHLRHKNEKIINCFSIFQNFCVSEICMFKSILFYVRKTYSSLNSNALQYNLQFCDIDINNIGVFQKSAKLKIGSVGSIGLIRQITFPLFSVLLCVKNSITFCIPVFYTMLQ